MEVLPDHIKILIYLFLITYMLSVGLETTHGQIIATLKNSRLILSTFLANWILIPIAGFILTSVIPVQAEIRIGLQLLSIAPGALFALNFARVSHSNVHLAVGLFLLLSLSSILITPILANFLFGTEAGVGRMLRIMILLLLLISIPLFAGRWIASLLSETTSKKMAKIIGIASILLFITVTLLTSDINKPAMKSLGMNGITIIVLLVIISWIIGWFLGGSDVNNKAVMSISSSLRNVAVCLPIAIHEFSSGNEIVPILAFGGIAIPMNFLFAMAMKIMKKHRKDTVVLKT